jgi:hypothetical protein
MERQRREEEQSDHHREQLILLGRLDALSFPKNMQYLYGILGSVAYKSNQKQQFPYFAQNSLASYTMPEFHTLPETNRGQTKCSL